MTFLMVVCQLSSNFFLAFHTNMVTLLLMDLTRRTMTTGENRASEGLLLVLGVGHQPKKEYDRNIFHTGLKHTSD